MLARLIAVGLVVVLWSCASEAQKVLVNIWDGTERRVISELLSDPQQLSHLKLVGPLVP